MLTIGMQVFIDGKLVGGCSDLQEAQANGELDKLIGELKGTAAASS